jgi:plasmid stability protein
MSDLLIRNIESHLLRRLRASARDHGRSLSEEAKLLLRKAMLEAPEKRRMGDALLALVPEEYRGDDLVFEMSNDPSSSPTVSD